MNAKFTRFKNFTSNIFTWSASLILLASLFVLPNQGQAQVSPPVAKTTKDHNKQVIGYITQWGPWKDIAGLIPKGSQNQLNVDYSQYTILNFSFFGVAVDGSIHSGDYRNPNIYQEGQVQNPAALVNTDIYSSWDLYLLQGELDVLYHIADGSYAYSLGYRNSGGGWSNANTGESGAFPLAVHKQGGKLGILDLAHQQGVKVMASIGGWSMCKHYGEMAADPTKKARFIADCKKLIAMGFDGIDLDWEYPGQAGMNFTGKPEDYTNFAILVEDIRAAIGSTKLITAAFTALPTKFNQFDWARLSRTMNYFNFMTYDYNGGWSNKAGHNAPLYDYPGAEYTGFSLDATTQGIKAAGIPLSKACLGVAFYGRGVVTTGPAALNAATAKRSDNVMPDGPVQTCADFSNWPKDIWDGTPNYNAIVAQTGSWTEHWDDNAKVPYKTNGSYFLSYDNEKSIGLKAQYVKDQQLAGVIVWTVAGDWFDLTTNTTQYGGKLVYSPNTKAPLVNKVNEVFGSGVVTNTPPTVSLTSPANNATLTAPATISIAANASDNGSVAKVEFFNGGTKLGEDLTAPYTYNWTGVAAGTYTITAKATDNLGLATTSTAVKVTVTTTGNNTPPTVSLIKPAVNANYAVGATVGLEATASDVAPGTVSRVAFYYNGTNLIGIKSIAPYTVNWTNVPAGTYTITAKATDNQGAVTTSAGRTITVGANNNPAPSVSLVKPAVNATYAAGTTVGMEATASDVAPGTVAKVSFYYNGTNLIGIKSVAPYTVNWTNVPAGTYTITAKATDNQGAVTTSASRTITITGSNANPTVTLTSPAVGATYTAPASFVISATASAVSPRTVAKVEFYRGTTLLFSDNVSPYTYTWSNVASGSYSITAKVTDSQGAIATTAARTITVGGGGTTCSVAAWVATTAYLKDAQVSKNGKVYVAKWWTQGEDPEVKSCADCVWQLIGACGSARLDNGLENIGMSIYPTVLATGKRLHIDLDQSFENLQVVITTIDGSKGVNYSYKNIKNIELDLPGLPKGMVLIKVIAGKKTLIKKIINN